MPEGGHDGAWYCGRRPQFDDDGIRNFCPPEGCPKGYCAKDDGWKEGDATPDRCLGIQPGTTSARGEKLREVRRMREVAQDWRRPELRQIEGPNDLKIYGGTIADDIERWADMLEAALAGRTASQVPGRETGWTIEGVMAEMLAVATASLDEDSPLIDEWPVDCRADVDRWQAVIRQALSQARGDVAGEPSSVADDRMRDTRSAVFSFVHGLLPPAYDERSTRYRASVQVEVARLLQEACTALTPKPGGDER